jgi:lipoyl(octanoyl) transferase
VIGYPILAIRRYCPSPKAYVRLLEEVLIRSLDMLRISGTRRPGTPGVWVRARKIGSVGVRISRGVTRHGFALNVTNALEPFSAVVPCGLVGCVMTSVALETDGQITLEAARQAVVRGFQEVFDMSLLEECVSTEAGVRDSGTLLLSGNRA